MEESGHSGLDNGARNKNKKSIILNIDSFLINSKDMHWGIQRHLYRTTTPMKGHYGKKVRDQNYILKSPK